MLSRARYEHCQLSVIVQPSSSEVVFPRIPETAYLSPPCSPPLMPVFSVGQVVSQICLDTSHSLI